MHTMVVIYINCVHAVYVVRKKESMTVKSEEEKSVPKQQTFFPRIIREFDDGPDEKPMVYGGV